MIFVTGGTGFLGSHLLLHLSESNEKILALKRTESNTDYTRLLFEFYDKKQQFHNIEWVSGDILDFHSLCNVIPEHAYIYHCAALVSFQKSNKEKIQLVNVKGTANLIDAALEKKSTNFCHVSSIAALGKAELITENTLWNPSEKHSDYALSKYRSELEVCRGIAEGLNAFIVQPSVIIGPWRKHDGIGKLFSAIEKGLKYYTSGINGFVDVNDVAKIMIMLMQSNYSNENFIISGENLSYYDLSSMIAEITGNKPPDKKASKLAIEITWRWFAFKNLFSKQKTEFNKTTADISQSISQYSNHKITERLSYKFTPIRESLANCYNFYKFLEHPK